MAQQQQNRRRSKGSQPTNSSAAQRPHAKSSAAKRPSTQRPPARRKPAHAAAHAHAAPARKRMRKRRSPWPIVVGILALVFVVLLAVFAVRSCGSKKAVSGSGQKATDQQEQVDANVQAVEEEPSDGTDINLLMVGDILFHYQVRMSGLQEDGSRNYDHVFEHVLDELKGYDIKVLNQETPLGGPLYTGSAPDGYDGYPEFNGPQEIGDAEAKAGFNVALKATNHAMDNAGNFDDPYTLVKSEQDFWASKHPEVHVIGEANPSDEDASASDVYVYEKDGFKVALLNYTLDLNGNEGFDYLGCVSMLEEDHVRETMAKARELADMVVVFPHWGEEYSLEPVEEQYEWAQLFVDEGADAIIGNHPHVIEPVTLLENADGKKVPCYWSTGNFISTSPSDESLIGGIAELTLHKDEDGTCSVTSAAFRPIVSHLGLSTDMTTYLITDWTDDLAASNWLDTDVNPGTYNTTLTPAWANEFCANVLGEGYDPTTGTFTLDL